MSGHTPTPWKIRDAPYGWDIFTPFFAETEPQWVASVTRSVGAMDERERLGMYPTRETCEANAALIVKAVNSHDALIEALEFIRDGYENHNINHVDYRVKVYEVALDALSRVGRQLTSPEGK